MTKNDISTLILKGNSMSIIEHEGIFYISCFCFDTLEDLAVFYSHKEVDNRFVCLPSKGKFHIVTSCYIKKKEAEEAFIEMRKDWYILNFPRIPSPTELMFYRHWYDEDYIREHWPEKVAAEEARMFRK